MDAHICNRCGVELPNGRVGLCANCAQPEPVREMELFAWVGEDEFGSGEYGLKQSIVPAGIVPMVGISRNKMEKYWDQAEGQAATYGKRIRLCRFVFAEVLRETRGGK